MTDQPSSKNWHRFLAGLEHSARDRSYDRHPDKAQLLGYLASSAPEVDEIPYTPPSERDLDAWLHGDAGWSTSTISLHVMTCSVCRKRLHLLREDQLSSAEPAPTGPWWQPIADSLARGLISPRIRWVATAGVIGIVFFSLTLSLLPGNPPVTDDTPPLPIERVEPRTGGIG